MNRISDHIYEKSLSSGGRLFALPMKTRDVVTIEGSILGGSHLLPRPLAEVPRLAGRLYDAGTKTRGKNVLRNALSVRGASLSFSGRGDRTHFSASCLPEDLPFILTLIAECLREPVFNPQELIMTRERAYSRLKDGKTDTRRQASHALRRLAYDIDHVNYAETDAIRERQLKAVTRANLLSFHETYVGQGGLVLAMTGDIDAIQACTIAERAFVTLPSGTEILPAKKRNHKKQEGKEAHLNIPEKANVDVYLGASIPVVLDDTNYLPMFMVTDMLGGGFASHLMQTVRERDGLTHGIRASLGGMAPDTDGFFYIWSTFSPNLFEKGVTTIRKETETFFTHHLRKELLEKKKDEIAGSYLIGLSTTSGMAHQLHSIGARGKDRSYIDEYPELIRALTLTSIKDVAAYISLSRLSLSAAGTFAK
ncbi:MAG: pitrilysin family protein [Nanoarchaeota archaeon]